MASIGIGYYQRSPQIHRRPTGARLFLCHLAPETASALRAVDPWAVIGLRADPGDDDHQADWSLAPERAADLFVEQRIIPAVNAVPVGIYSYCVGINERWPNNPDGLRWRAAFEKRVCDRVQYGVAMPAGWRSLPYAWGGISVGCLESQEVALFAEVWRRAWAVNYHGYLAPQRTRVEQETDDWYLWRPTRIWLPELRRLGIPLRFLLGECGPFYPDVRGAELARLQVAISQAMADECRRVGVEYVGACAYGFGLMSGSQEAWELEGTEDVFAQANAIAEPAPVVPAPTKPENPAGGETMKLSEQYPQQWAEWVAAGGDLNNFRKHLLGSNVIQPTPEDLHFLADEAMASIKQLQGALANYPFPR